MIKNAGQSINWFSGLEDVEMDDWHDYTFAHIVCLLLLTHARIFPTY